MTIVYYNEFDKDKAAWLKELIQKNIIAYGHVDTRDIWDVKPSDLRGYSQCHFFAGIGVWSYALRQAGVRDSERVWTVSCPCQPFSTAGKNKGFNDERHLWPAFFWLVQQCTPFRIFGEQVATGRAKEWIDLISTDLENINYTIGATITPACGFGAPHKRERYYFVADCLSSRLEILGKQSARKKQPPIERSSTLSSMADNILQQRSQSCTKSRIKTTEKKRDENTGTFTRFCSNSKYWHSIKWLQCQDGKFRPIKPGISPLVNGSPARVVRLRGYGDAIVAPQAIEFIKAASS